MLCKSARLFQAARCLHAPLDSSSTHIYSSLRTMKSFIPIKSLANASSRLVIQKQALSSSYNAENAAPTIEVDGLKLIKLTKNDFDVVMELLLDDFIRNEPLSNALDLTPQEGYWLFKELVMSTIDTSVSYAFRSSDGKLAAARLCNILERPSDNVSLQTVFILTAYEMIEQHGLFAELENQSEQMAQKVGPKSYEIVRLVNELESKAKLENQSEQMAQKVGPKSYEIVRLVNELESKAIEPEVRRLLNVVILSCHRNWTRRGLCSKLLDFDMDNQRKMGIDGAISEATAYNSQNLFAKYGYIPIYEIKHDSWLDKNGERIFKCRDQTTTAQLVFRKY
uniref:N-acetyltransferase domain-containing protein n=1 Tax=Ascaris lumbricoides TaxID=6252 RepID=A0A0M3IMP3_ASCLU